MTLETAISDEQPSAPPTSAGPDVSRRRNAAVLAAVTVAGFALPAVAYLWFIQHYAVNVVYADQWSDLILLNHLYQGHLSLGALWAQHNENRMLFPNLVVLAVAATSHFDTVTENFVSAGVLFLAVALLVLAHRRRAPTLGWLWYCPVAIVLVSLVEYEDALWGFQLGWYLSLAAMAAAIYVVDRERLTPAVMAGGLAAAVVASYSSFEGLFVWPAVLVLFWFRRRPGRYALAWLGGAALTISVYFYGLNPNQGTPSAAESYAFHNPLMVARFFFLAIGDVVGQQFQRGGPDPTHPWVLALGVAIFLIGVAAIVLARPFTPSDDGRPIGVALIVVGVMFAAGISITRAVLGSWEAGASRYSLFDLLILVGAYLVVVTPVPAGAAVPGWARPARLVLGGALALALCLQIGLSIPNGLNGGRTFRARELLAADVSVNSAAAPRDLVYFALYPEGYIQQVYELLPVARAHRLSLFADPATVAYYRRVGLYHGQTLTPP